MLINIKNMFVKRSLISTGNKLNASNKLPDIIFICIISAEIPLQTNWSVLKMTFQFSVIQYKGNISLKHRQIIKMAYVITFHHNCFQLFSLRNANCAALTTIIIIIKMAIDIVVIIGTLTY